MSHIEVSNLYKQYSKHQNYSLENVNAYIKAGAKYGLLGPNGAGKTTLISILCGFLESTSGSIKYVSSDKKEVSGRKLRSIIGWVPQEYALYNDLSPLQNLQYFGAFYNLGSMEIRQRSEKLLEVLGLSEVAHQKVGSFSGGMKRRLNLAIGIIHEPAVLFLDEPTVGVDVQSKHAIIRILNELSAEGVTIIYTSHHMNEAQEFCDEILLIDHGMVLKSGSTSSLLADNQTQDLQSLFIRLTGEDYRD